MTKRKRKVQWLNCVFPGQCREYVNVCFAACPPQYYGAGCKLRCECGLKGKCDRFRGCVCPGRHGARCQRQGKARQSLRFPSPRRSSALSECIPALTRFLSTDEAPVVVGHLMSTELNSGIEYIANCTATGQPVPLHGEIHLLKPDKTIIYVSHAKVILYELTIVLIEAMGCFENASVFEWK